MRKSVLVNAYTHSVVIKLLRHLLYTENSIYLKFKALCIQHCSPQDLFRFTLLTNVTVLVQTCSHHKKVAG